MHPRPAGDTPSPDLFQRFSRRVLRLGLPRSVAVVTLVVLLAAALISQAVISAFGHGDRLIALASTAAASLLITPFAAWLALRLVFELEATRARLAELAVRDELTGISNRRHFMATLQREWDLSRRHPSIGTLLLIDADRFKVINDTHGHLCGDELLRSIAHAIGASLRQVDLVARFGGEEFIVFLSHTDSFGALDVAERIRSRVEQTRVQCNGKDVGTTVSIGIAPIRQELPTLDWMIHEADTALYAAKAAGRNCIRTLEFSQDADNPEARSFKA